MKLFFISFILIFFMGVHCSVSAQSEYFKGIYMYNFAKFIVWPSEYYTGDFVIGVFGSGDSPVYKELNLHCKGRLIGTQKIVIKKIPSIYSLQDDFCHILYLPSENSSLVRKIIEKTKGKPVLLITDKTGLCIKGADINYIDVNSTLGYEINISQMKQKKLYIKSNLKELGIDCNP